MNWNLRDDLARPVVSIDGTKIVVANHETPLPIIPMVFHGTRDYIDGVIFALEITERGQFYPLMVEKLQEV